MRNLLTVILAGICVVFATEPLSEQIRSAKPSKRNLRHFHALADIPSESPTISPSNAPSEAPTRMPTVKPTKNPTVSPSTSLPTLEPTALPSVSPTVKPTKNPTLCPTFAPTIVPTSAQPTVLPTVKPTKFPTTTPTPKPTSIPTTAYPTIRPTLAPTEAPTLHPTLHPTEVPTLHPTLHPTEAPTFLPSHHPTEEPTLSFEPTEKPSISPTVVPTRKPTVSPTFVPTIKPTTKPTVVPTIKPTIVPTVSPTAKPTVVPTITPTFSPTVVPTTAKPTIVPTACPTALPSIVPTAKPTALPSIVPTAKPTALPSIVPTVVPTVVPTTVPSFVPTVVPTLVPTVVPTTAAPTIKPTITPTVTPTRTPTVNPTVSRQPTVVPTAAPTTAYTHGMIGAIAGVVGKYGYQGNNAMATSAYINQPGRAAVDTGGNVYFHDTGNALVRKVTKATGFISYIVGKPYTTSDWDTAWEGLPGTSVLLTDNNPFNCLYLDTNGVFYFSHTNSYRIMKLDTDMKISTYLGNGVAADAGNGGAATDPAMSMDTPWSFWLDSNGQTYIAGEGDIVRRIDASGIINDYAGSTYGFSGDGGPPLSAAFKTPHRVSGDSVGNVYIRDHGNTRIRFVNPSGIVGTYIGNDNVGYNGENVPRTSAQLGSATSAGSYVDMTVDDTTGDLLFTDQLQFRVRSISKATGLVKTLAGTGARGNAGNGGRATSATLGGPSAIFYEKGAGRVIFGDWYQLRYLY